MSVFSEEAGKVKRAMKITSKHDSVKRATVKSAVVVFVLSVICHLAHTQTSSRKSLSQPLRNLFANPHTFLN